MNHNVDLESIQVTSNTAESTFLACYQIPTGSFSLTVPTNDFRFPILGFDMTAVLVLFLSLG